MEFTVEEMDPKTTRVALSGRLDAVGAEVLEAPLIARLASMGRNIIVDLSAVPFVGSLGIRVLVSAARTIQRQGCRMALYGLVPAVSEALDLVSLDDLIPIALDDAAARAVVSA